MEIIYRLRKKGKHISDVVEATEKLSKQISRFLNDNYEEFLSFDDVKLYKEWV